MFSLYSKGCEYILRGLVCASLGNNKKSFRVEDVCRAAEVPEFFTRKSFQVLAQKGILKAIRGPGGGYVLMKDPAEVSLLEIIRAVEGEQTFERCAMGLSICGDEAPCPIHEVWKKLKKTLIEELRQTSLRQLIAAETNKKIFILSAKHKRKVECLP